MKLPHRFPSRITAQRTAVVAALTILVSGCSVFEEDKIDYKSAAKAPSLEVPPDLSQLRKDSRYAIESNSATARPAAGLCCNPCPLNPFANTTLSISGWNPMIAF